MMREHRIRPQEVEEEEDNYRDPEKEGGTILSHHALPQEPQSPFPHRSSDGQPAPPTKRRAAERKKRAGDDAMDSRCDDDVWN